MLNGIVVRGDKYESAGRVVAAAAAAAASSRIFIARNCSRGERTKTFLRLCGEKGVSPVDWGVGTL